MKKIFISRPLKSDSIFQKELEKANFEVYGESLLEFELVPLDKIPEVDWIFFYSQKGVRFFFDQVRDNFIFLSPIVQMAGFGKKTAEVIKSYGIECDFVGTGKAISTTPKFIDVAKGQKVLFPRAENSQRSVQQLIDNELVIEDLIIYKNFPKRNFDFPKMDYLVFTSPLNAKVFFQKYKYEKGQKVFSIGETTAKTLNELGIEEVLFPKKPSEKNLVQLVLETTS